VRSETLEGRRWIGRVLRDKWRIDARISRGGVGTVYAATHKNNGSRAAIKVLHPEFARDDDTRSRFLQEGYAANQVNHPGVVRILDDDTTEDGHAYLVMELLEGELLETRRVRKGGKLPLPDVYEVGEQLLDVLASAHDKGIVHRDIKPDNLFITNEGRLKVLDFGFAQMKSSFRTEQTATGFLLGTPGFMSPEQAVGNRPQIDAQTDIWAVGATLFTLISGEPVHDGQSAAEMLVAAANFPPRSLSSVTNGMNPRLVQLVDRAVAFDKVDRWPNARSMQNALRAVSGKQTAGQMPRRSIPDDGPTMMADTADIEELDESLLEDAKQSWESMQTRPQVLHDDTGNEERTVMAHGPLPAEAIPSAITRPPPAAGRRHAADDDGPTVMVPQSTTDPSELRPNRTEPPPQTHHMANAGMIDPHSDGGTLIMESPARDDAGSSGAYPHITNPPMSPHQAYQHQQQPYGHGAPQHMAPASHDPMRSGRGDEMMYVAAPAARVPAVAEEPNRILVYVAVAVVTMVVVIVVGLIVLAASD
jgi:serine/threonine protein kinase